MKNYFNFISSDLAIDLGTVNTLIHHQDNGIVLLDEYDFYTDRIKFPGAKKAIDEFCKEKNINVIKHFTGKYYIQK